MKKNTLILLIATNCIFLQMPLLAQLKTKIYPTGLPKDLIEKSYPLNEIFVAAPLNLEALKISGSGKENLSDYRNKFAEIINVDYDLLTTAKKFSTNDNVFYSMKLNADKALNISLQFSEFQLRPNAILQIRTDFEITENITAKDNNPSKIWATRIYQGGVLYITLSVPKKEISEIKVKINKIGFGFRQIGGGFFGNPGNSGNCNINVLCPAGTGWENERNSVALIVSGGNEICTGTLVMNTCGTNVPYLLTANHCLNSTVANWVFQFQTWSTDCVTNTGWREDVQFNGCELRANNAATDFALVELNQTPQANSGIRYSGWTRDPNPAITTTSIHHPSGDLMKISHDFQPPVSVPWPGFANNHWRATFDQGIVQHGSSGSALYDENHRILGQLHGNQNNICNIGDNNCFCTVQLPSIGEYGRFDISWTGGGTNATRLSNWLDPNNSGAMTTNTTNVSGLVTHISNLSISGDHNFCNSGTYTLNAQNVFPPGTSIVWSIAPSNSATLTPNGNQVTVTPSWGAGNAILTATLTNTCGATSTQAQKQITTALPDHIIDVLDGAMPLEEADIPMNTSLSLGTRATEPYPYPPYYLETPYQNAATASYSWQVHFSDPYGGHIWYNLGTHGYGYTPPFIFDQYGQYEIILDIVNNSCASQSRYFNRQIIFINPYGRFSVSPNPSSGNIRIQPSVNATRKTQQKALEIRKVELIDKMGTVRYVQNFAKGLTTVNLSVNQLPNDIYTLRIFDGAKWHPHKLVIQH